MKQGWEIKRLSEIGKVYNGNSINKKVKKDNYADLEDGIPFIATKNISYESEIDYDNGIKIPFEEKSLFKTAPKNTVLICAEGGSAGRKIGFTNQEVCFGNKLFALATNKNIESRYVYYYYFSSSFQKHFAVELAGIIGGVSMNKFKDLEIPLPPLPQQQRIVAILDEAFAAIAKAKTNAEQNLKNAKELFESYLQGVFEKKGDGWEEKTLGEVLVKTETVDPTKKPNEEIIYLDVSSVNKETKEIENATVLLGKDAPSRARKLVRTNDVIFATVRPTHSRVALITEEYDEQVCSTGYFVLRAKEFLNNNLVYYFLLTYSFNKQMEKLQKGASYPAVTDSEVKGIYISFPKSIKEQQTIVKKLDALSAETQKLQAIYQQKINNLEELKKSILAKAFNGELKT
ncbi:MAG: restriction endonuclease subunit S [Limnohabitans sp.]|nr:restriction endonuclease subunit S [Limnohabitans sp.]